VALRIGSSRLPLDAFNDVWRRLSNAFKGEPAVVAYDLMNEPHVHGDIPAAGHPSPQKAWEIASQGVVEAIRRNDDLKLIMVPGYAHVYRWAENHPAKWIDDHADDHMYTVHQYFDAYRGLGTGGGKYRYSYRDENAYLRDQGY
jgi:endoglucanase